MYQFNEFIVLNPEIRSGKPCVIDTRITVQDILSWLAAGMSYAEIIEDFPELNMDKIRAALSYASHREMRTKVIAA